MATPAGSFRKAKKKGLHLVIRLKSVQFGFGTSDVRSRPTKGRLSHTDLKDQFTLIFAKGGFGCETVEDILHIGLWYSRQASQLSLQRWNILLKKIIIKQSVNWIKLKDQECHWINHFVTKLDKEISDLRTCILYSNSCRFLGIFLKSYWYWKKWKSCYLQRSNCFAGEFVIPTVLKVIKIEGGKKSIYFNCLWWV